jgi:hypothetical protein
VECAGRDLAIWCRFFGITVCSDHALLYMNPILMSRLSSIVHYSFVFMLIAIVICSIKGYSTRFLNRTMFCLLTGQSLFVLDMLIYVLLPVQIA